MLPDLSSTIKNTPGPDVQMNCPGCGSVALARTYEREEKIRVYHVPFLTQREVYVECKRCRMVRLATVPLAELDRYSADELDAHLHERVSIIVKFLALASLVLFCVPFVGLIIGLSALLASYRTGGWPRAVSVIGVLLSLVLTSVVLYFVHVY